MRKSKNKDLKEKYDEMHKQGATSWFSDGREERETILKMGEPWEGKMVVEVGCGEGDLMVMMEKAGARLVYGIDYSDEATDGALKKYPWLHLRCGNVFEPQLGFWPDKLDVLVMQGVLEHFNDPFRSLEWMMKQFNPKVVITSSPCFYNFRGIVWMTLDLVGAVMSKTDLHYLHPYQFAEFCDKNGYDYYCKPCDDDWGNGWDMVEDLKQRIPLAIRDGGLIAKYPIEDFIQWIRRCPVSGIGATMVYKISK